MRLTEPAIRHAIDRAQAEGRAELADEAEPGLRLRVGAGGAEWSVLASGVDGRRIRLPIGRWPTVDLIMARDQARRLKQAMDRTPGQDAGPALTLGRLLDLYERRRLSQLRKGRVIRRALDMALGDFHHRDASAVTRREIGTVIDMVSERAPIHANRMLAYAKAFFAWSVGRGYLDASPAASISMPTREVGRDRTPSLSELGEIWQACDHLGYPYGPATQLLILTAARRDEVGALQVAELALDAAGGRGCWTLPANRSKNGRAIRAPLCASAVEVIAQALAGRRVEGPFLFSTSGIRPVSGWSKAKGRLDKLIAAARAANGAPPIEPWRFHDLRRSFATSACDLLQIDPVVVDRCLNHVGASTTSTVSRIYARSELFDQRRDALERWASLVAQAARRESAPAVAATTAATVDPDR